MDLKKHSLSRQSTNSTHIIMSQGALSASHDHLCVGGSPKKKGKEEKQVSVYRADSAPAHKMGHSIMRGLKRVTSSHH